MLKGRLTILILTAGLISNTLGFSAVKAAPNPSSSMILQNMNTNEVSKNPVENELMNLDNEISKNIVEVNKQNKKLSDIEKQIILNKNSITDLSKKIKATKDLSNKRIRAMYINGYTSLFLSTLFNSDNLEDLANNSVVVKEIIQFDRNLLKKFNSEKSELDKKKSELSNDKLETIKLRDAVNKKLVLLANQKRSSQQLLSKLSKVSTNNVKTDNNPSLSRGATGIFKNGSGLASDNKIVNYSFNFLGIPYVWGGTSPAGFDCSGLTQYVYAHFGINIPRVAEDQQNSGIPVISRNDLIPGDLIFWGYPAHHVGMYIGNNKYIQAPHTGDVVKISELEGYTSAQRIIK